MHDRVFEYGKLVRGDLALPFARKTHTSLILQSEWHVMTLGGLYRHLIKHRRFIHVLTPNPISDDSGFLA